MPQPLSGFLIRNPRLLSFDVDDDGDAGGHNPLDVSDLGDSGPGPDLDDGTSTDDEPAGQESLGDGLDDLFADNEPEEPPADDPGVSKNPSVQAALDKVREALPKGLHSLIIDEILAPELTKTQQGFDQQMSQMQPYRDLSKHGVSAEDAIEALRVRQFILDSPDRALRDIAQIAQVRGLNPAEILGIQAAQQQAPEGGNADTALRAILGDQADDIDLDADPAMKLVLEKLATLEAGQQQQAQDRAAQQQQRETAEIEAAMQTLKSGFASRGFQLNEQAVMQYAVAYVGSLPENMRTIEPLEALKAGAKAWLADVSAAAQQQAGRRAPRVGAGRGGLGTAGDPQRPAPPKTIADRVAAWKADAAAGKFNSGE